VDGVALGIPATVDWDHNHVRSECEELPWIEDSANKKQLRDRLKRPVLMVNDVEALLVGEWLWGELKGYSSGVVISLGESMGSALLWNGTPQQGRRGSIMELEHVSLDTDGAGVAGSPPGSSRYWLSGKGLRDRLDEVAADCSLESLFESDREDLLELKNRFRDKLAHLIGTVVMMLDPERIVLAGGLTGSADHWLPGVEERMNDFVMEQFQGLPSVQLGQLCGDEVVKGPAAFWDWQEASQ
jgi:predicted NBD/HSP70 family sugar kinase